MIFVNKGTMIDYSGREVVNVSYSNTSKSCLNCSFFANNANYCVYHKKYLCSICDDYQEDVYCEKVNF